MSFFCCGRSAKRPAEVFSHKGAPSNKYQEIQTIKPEAFWADPNAIPQEIRRSSDLNGGEWEKSAAGRVPQAEHGPIPPEEVMLPNFGTPQDLGWESPRGLDLQGVKLSMGEHRWDGVYSVKSVLSASEEQKPAEDNMGTKIAKYYSDGTRKNSQITAAEERAKENQAIKQEAPFVRRDSQTVVTRSALQEGISRQGQFVLTVARESSDPSETMQAGKLKRAEIETADSFSQNTPRLGARRIQTTLGEIKSVFTKEIIGELVMDQKAREAARDKRVAQDLFLFRGRKVLWNVVEHLDLQDRLALIEAFKPRIWVNRTFAPYFLGFAKRCLLDFINMQVVVPGISVLRLADSKREKPDVFRYPWSQDCLMSYWNTFVSFDRNLGASGSSLAHLQVLTEAPYPKLNEINKDIERTFPEFYCNEPRKEALRKVLIGLSRDLKHIGYVQGLNAIAGGLLWYLSEAYGSPLEECPDFPMHVTFTVLRFLLARRSLSMMYERSLYGFDLLTLEVKLWVKTIHPDLYDLLERIQFDYKLILSRWILNLFSTVFPMKFVVQLVNHIFLEGLLPVIKLCVAMLGRWDGNLESEEYEEVYRSISKHDYSQEIGIDVIVKYPLDLRVCLQIEETFKIDRVKASQQLSIELVQIEEQEPELYYLRRTHDAPSEELKQLTPTTN